MNDSNHSDYIRQLHFDLKALSGDESTARRVLKLREEVLALSMLDFSPAEATLREGYSPAAGGRPARNPINMLRSIALMALKGQSSFNKWVEELRDHPELHALSGFDREKSSPGVGTFYDFCDRLLDGPFQKKCPHTPAKRSSAFKGSRGAFRRNLGLRIDHILVSNELYGRAAGCSVDRKYRGVVRPSDHAPLKAFFEI